MYISTSMKGLRYILIVLIVVGMASARLSDKYSSVLHKKDSGVKSNAVQHELQPIVIEDDDDSVKWKRRHKRRKKARRPKRGR